MRSRGFAVALLCLLAACGPAGEDPGRTDSQSEAPPSPAVAEPVVSAPPTADDAVVIPGVLGERLAERHYDLDGLIDQGVLRVLVGYSHTHYFMDGLHIRGISAENLRRFEPFLQQRIGAPRPRLSLLPIPVARDEMIDFLAKGMGDIAVGNITITDERAAVVDFSVPLRRDVAEVVVLGPDTPVIEDIDGLAGRTVHVRRSSSFFESISETNDVFVERGLKPIEVVELDEHLQTEDVLELVSAGVIGVTVADDHMAEFWSDVHENIVVRDDLVLKSGRQIAWAIRKDLTGIKPIVDEYVQTNRDGTLVGNVLFQRYLQNNRYVRNAAASADRRRFLQMAEIFQRYSNDYDFDWLLIAAQGYQESRLIQNLRSPAGAIGVMQLLPATAAAPSVGITNIEEVEANIHAGHKYLRHVADRYFDDPEIDELNRHLFSFAAYNAGPTRISRLRRQAGRNGLDANQWFGEVEQLVAEKVGMEPVTYVRNIFKYYVTYKLMQDQTVGKNTAGIIDRNAK